MSGLCVAGSDSMLAVLPCHHTRQKISTCTIAWSGSRLHQRLTGMAQYLFKSFGHNLVPSWSTRSGGLRFRLLNEAVSKGRVATSSFLARSVHYSRKNTYQDNNYQVSRTVNRTSKLHIHTTDEPTTPRKTIMAPKQKIIIDTDPVCHHINRSNCQHPGQHIL